MKGAGGGRVYRDIDLIDLSAPNDDQTLSRLLANRSLLFEFEDVGLYLPLGMKHYYDALGTLGTVNLSFGLTPVSPKEIAAQQQVLDLFNVRYILSRERLNLPATTVIGEANGIFVLRNEDALPRAYWLRSYRCQGKSCQSDATPSRAALGTGHRLGRGDSQEKAHDWLRQADFDPHRQVILEEAIPELAANQAPQPYQPVSITLYESQRVVIESKQSTDGILVLADTHYPGWQAHIDGQPTTIRRANGLFRAVYVPAGTHEVVFTYQPTSFRGGVIISLASLLLLLLFSWRRRHIAPSELVHSK